MLDILAQMGYDTPTPAKSGVGIGVPIFKGRTTAPCAVFSYDTSPCLMVGLVGVSLTRREPLTRYANPASPATLNLAFFGGRLSQSIKGKRPMSNLINFTFNNLPVRIIDQQGNPWFVASDVCSILEIQNTTDALKALDDDEKAKLENTPSFNLGVHKGVKKINIINESGLYALILRSRKSIQKGTVQHKFRKWITSEVLPTIRKTGTYTQTKTTTKDRRPLVEAVNKLCRKHRLAHSDIYRMVHQHINGAYGLEIRAIDDIPYHLLDDAIAYVHMLNLSMRAPIDNQALYTALADSAIHLRDYLRLLKTLKGLPMMCDETARNIYANVADNYNDIVRLSQDLELINAQGTPMFTRGRINWYHGGAYLYGR